jgi:hypothetical protein
MEEVPESIPLEWYDGGNGRCGDAVSMRPVVLAPPAARRHAHLSWPHTDRVSWATVAPEVPAAIAHGHGSSSWSAWWSHQKDMAHFFVSVSDMPVPQQEQGLEC